MVTAEYRRDHATLAAFCRLRSLGVKSIFGDRNRSTLNRCTIAIYVDDKMELCRFCRDKNVLVSPGSTWEIGLCWRISPRCRPQMKTSWRSFRDQVAKERCNERMFIISI
jgi:hypothetical protein